MGEISSMLEEMRAFLQARLPQAQVGLAHPGDQRPFPPPMTASAACPCRALGQWKPWGKQRWRPYWPPA